MYSTILTFHRNRKGEQTCCARCSSHGPFVTRYWLRVAETAELLFLCQQIPPANETKIEKPPHPPLIFLLLLSKATAFFLHRASLLRPHIGNCDNSTHISVSVFCPTHQLAKLNPIRKPFCTASAYLLYREQVRFSQITRCRRLIAQHFGLLCPLVKTGRRLFDEKKLRSLKKTLCKQCRRRMKEMLDRSSFLCDRPWVQEGRPDD